MSVPLLRFLSDWLSDRRFRVAHFGGVSGERTLFRGVPQGGVLSPLIWLLFLSGLESSISSHWPSARRITKVGDSDGNRVVVLIYADDVTLLILGRGPREVAATAREAASAVESALSAEGL